MKKFFGNWFLILVALAIILRIFLATVTLHSDLWAFDFASGYFSQGVVNIYEKLHNLPLDYGVAKFYGTDFFTWPPLTYFLLGSLHFILTPFFDAEFFKLTFTNLELATKDPGLFRQIFLLKLPYFLFDLGILILLVKIFREKRQKILAAAFWLLNPVALYSTFMIGQFDVIPTFFVVLATFLALRRKHDLALLSLGIGGALKIFPLLLILPAVLVLERNFRQRVKLLILGFAPFVITILPFLGSEAFRAVALFSAQSQKLLFAEIMVSGAEGVSLVVLGYFLILAIVSKFYGQQNLWRVFLLVFLLIFSLTNFHPQWFIWITPFLIITLIYNFATWPQILLIFLSFAGITLLFEPSLSFGLFSTLNSNLANFDLSKTISVYFDVFQLKTILRSILAAASLWLGLKTLYFSDFARK